MIQSSRVRFVFRLIMILFYPCVASHVARTDGLVHLLFAFLWFPTTDIVPLLPLLSAVMVPLLSDGALAQ